jgi:hypothetical protein
MRALATLAVAVAVSWLVAAALQVALGLALSAPEEMVFALVAEFFVALFVAIVFGLVLVSRGGSRAIAYAAATMVVLGVVSLAGLEAFALADEAAAVDPSDFPLMLEVGIPGLITVLLQAWLVRAYLRRQLARATLVPFEG